jgi:hypothetical protein
MAGTVPRQVRDGFQVWHTEDARDTFQLYARLSVALAQKYQHLQGPQGRGLRGGLREFKTFNKDVDAAKKVEHCVTTVFGMMLMQVICQYTQLCKTRRNHIDKISACAAWQS